MKNGKLNEKSRRDRRFKGIGADIAKQLLPKAQPSLSLCFQ